MSILLFSLTRKDFRIIPFSGTGPGGQARNKVQACVRVFHDPSGCQAIGQMERSLQANIRSAIKRLASQEKFKHWCRMEVNRRNGLMAEAERVTDEAMSRTSDFRVDIQSEEGTWIPEPSYD
jgi:protein subunit release factor B